MTRNRAQEWETRREIPDPQVRDAADQYEAARELLSAQPPGSGVLLPLMNTAAVEVRDDLERTFGSSSQQPEMVAATCSLSVKGLWHPIAGRRHSKPMQRPALGRR